MRKVPGAKSGGNLNFNQAGELVVEKSLQPQLLLVGCSGYHIHSKHKRFEGAYLVETLILLRFKTDDLAVQITLRRTFLFELLFLW